MQALDFWLSMPHFLTSSWKQYMFTIRQVLCKLSMAISGGAAMMLKDESQANLAWL
jgi:hypothetical protein